MFDIRFVGLPTLAGNITDELDAQESERPVIVGQIQKYKYVERFISPLDVWSKQEYESQWRDARRRLASGAVKSCYVLTVKPMHISSAVEIWGVWNVRTEYRLQNLHLFPRDQDIRDLHQPYGALREYTNITEEGFRIHDLALPIDTSW